MLESLKELYIQVLQQHADSWSSQKIALEVHSDDLFDMLACSNIPLNELKGIYKSKPQTVLLWDTNFILSPIHIDNNIELPIIELFFDNNNFVLFTTHNIHISNQQKNNTMSILHQLYHKGEAQGISLGEACGKAEGLLLTAKIIKLYTKGFEPAYIAEKLETELEIVQAAIAEYEAE